MKEEKGVLPVAKKREYDKIKLSYGVFMVWTTLMLLGVYTWHWGTLWPALAVMARWVVPLVHIGNSVKKIRIYTRELCQVSLMSYRWVWLILTETGVLCLRKCLQCSLCCPRFLCVWTRPFLLFWCNVCMVSYQSINHQSSSLNYAIKTCPAIRHVLKCDSTQDGGTLVWRSFSPWRFISSWLEVYSHC